MLIQNLLRRSGIGAAAMLSAALLAAPAYAQEMTAERLVNADSEAHNWLTVHRTYDGHRYSPLDQINSDNIDELRLAYVVPLGIPSAGGRYSAAQNEGTPLVEDGFVYVQSGWSVVSKVDVTSGTHGKVVWQWTPEMDREYISESACCGAENRGIGLWKDQVIALTLDGRAVSLNKDTGEVTWERQIADRTRAETFTVAPLVIGDVAIIGPAGGEYGIRGWIEAINLTDGSTAWRTYVIPGPGEPGHDTWEGDAWMTGGGSIWQTGTYDPDLNLIYYGIGNPSPQFDAEYRPGDNLYTESILALDVADGSIEWFFQFTPNDPYDYDEVGEAQLLDVEIDGQPRKIMARAARNGHVYILDRTSGEFITGREYLDFVNWSGGLDPKTGMPNTYDPTVRRQTYAEGTVSSRGMGPGLMCPGLAGGKNWQPATLSAQTGLLYVTAREGCNNHYTAVEAPVPTITGGDYNVVQVAGWRGRGTAPEDQRPPIPENVDGGTSLTAINPITSEVVAKVRTDDLPQGLLSTAGGLIFGGQRNGLFKAYDDETLEVVWEYNTVQGLYSPPITFEVDGKQFVAVLAGGPGFQVDAMYVFSQ